MNEKNNPNNKIIKEVLENRILVLDGAMGTAIQEMDLGAGDFGGDKYEGCNEYLNITKPGAIKEIHRSYLEAGSDIIETNTFGSTPFVLGEYGLSDKAYEISRAAAIIAKEETGKYSQSPKPRFVAGSMGPTTKTLSLTGGISFDELVDNFLVQARGLLDGGVDLFIIETIQDTLNLKAAGIALEILFRESGTRLPTMISGTIEPMGTTLAGQNIESLAVSIAHLSPLSIGLNCATGPEFMTDHLRSLSNITPSFTSCMPNAGLPDADGNYLESPDKVARTLERFCEEGWVNILGGCCGTTPDHIRRISDLAASYKPRKMEIPKSSFLSGIDLLSVEEGNRPVLIAERTNVIGSKKFKELIINGKLEEGAEIARKQVRSGASIVDVCMSNPDRDELEDMNAFMPILAKKIKSPIMIDSTDSRVIEAALKLIQGKSIINSINLENGEKRFLEVVPFAKKYGSALVVGTIDEDPEQGMGITRKRKIEIAQRSYELLTKKYLFPEEDIYFDTLVFPVGTGDTRYIGSSQATIEAISDLKKIYPNIKTTLGISNVSFGLPLAGREVLNSVFLYHAVKAGLDTAIVNAQKLRRYPSLSEEERELAENLLFHTKENYDQVLKNFSLYYKDKKVKNNLPKTDYKNSPELHIKNCLVDGSKEYLSESLEILLKGKNMKPIEIVNGPLMSGMAEVGRLFNANQLIVAEVLQSAEAMKHAVSYLEPFMDKSESLKRGTMLLATVKGDVHDIGKNLVDIILSNNGFNIINLGIKIPPEKIIESYRKFEPDYIGLSGLLVKSAQQMITTAQDLKNAGIAVPLIVGGAALSREFVLRKISPVYNGKSIYAKDAMDGLSILTRLSKGEELPEEKSNDSEKKQDDKPAIDISQKPTTRESQLTYDYGPRQPMDLKIHTLPGEGMDAKQLLEKSFQYINPGMLYKKHLGFRGNTREAMEKNDPKFLELKKYVHQAQEIMLTGAEFDARAVFAFFRAASSGDDIIILSGDGQREIEKISFPRQAGKKSLCAADYIAPIDSATPDYLGMFVASAGRGIRPKSEELKEKGDFLLSHTLQALALETAEGMAEMLHQKMRQMWNWPDPPDWTLRKLFRTDYQGIRLSFGYPACPDLEGQKIIWDLLEVDKKIGVLLTDGYMMDPEASVSALVFQHPDGRYFSVKE